ncbi:MAG TPA: hypothetical protein VIK14_12190 [Ignavibacteria bacterium]
MDEELKLEKNYDNTVVPEFKTETEKILWKFQHNELDDNANWDWEDGEENY